MEKGWPDTATTTSPPGPHTTRTATLFAQGLQTRGPLEPYLGDRIGSL
jgi:hypothetical protein